MLVHNAKAGLGTKVAKAAAKALGLVDEGVEAAGAINRVARLARGGARSIRNLTRLRSASGAARLHQGLQLQREISKKANQVALAMHKWLLSKTATSHRKYGRWARTYQALYASPTRTARQTNFAKGILGRFIDRRMNSWMRDRYSARFPEMRLDRRVPGSHRLERPDVFIPDLGGPGESYIFDFGGPSKLRNIESYQGLAKHIIAIVPRSMMR